MVELFKSQIKGENRVLIVGFGKEGKSTYNWIRNNLPCLKTGVSDKNHKALESIGHNDNTEIYGGDNHLKAIDKYNVIIKSPGIKLNPEITKNKTVLTQTGLFIKRFSKQITGVTGTKGKSTTASLITHFLKSYDKNAVLLGNIGIPAFDMLNGISDDTLIVYELSAHQLKDVKHSPHIAVLLNIFPEHLDFFENFEKYREAKLNIFKYQTPNDISINGLLFGSKYFDDDDLQYIAGKLAGNPDIFKKVRDLTPLKGNHNIFNIIAAMAAVTHSGITHEMCLKVLPDFNTLPHRLEFIGEVNGVKYYNDSISTVPQATIAAVKSLKNVDVLLLGGFDRGLDYSGLTAFLPSSTVKYIFFNGKAGTVMYNLLKNRSGKIRLVQTLNIADAVNRIKNLKGIKTVLLSPAAASYDAFHNFEHRGDTFRHLVLAQKQEQ
jgi:UDP-N-acetylmuramoylalanine--D-glutamate ligase